MGSKKKTGYTLQEFQALYRADAFYNWFGLDDPLMYAAHKAAGGMTSVYRQIGTGCEALFRRILQDVLHLSETDTIWSYDVTKEDGNVQTLSLDARIPLSSVPDHDAQERIRKWIEEKADEMRIASEVASALSGIVFEVRQGYKSKDSKRQNADIRNAGAAYTRAYLPCAMILSTQIDSDIFNRYQAARWAVLKGNTGNTSPLTSTYAFMRDVVGYDLSAFFERNHNKLREEVEKVLIVLLKPS